MMQILRRVLGLVAGTLLMAMMLLTAADVGGRYFFNAPVMGAQELTEMLMASAMFAALPLVTAAREHVTVSLFDSAFRGRLLVVRSLLVDLFSLVALLAFGWRLFAMGETLAEYGDQTLFLGLPLAPVAWFMAAMSFASALLLVLMMISTVRDPGNALGRVGDDAV